MQHTSLSSHGFPVSAVYKNPKQSLQSVWHASTYIFIVSQFHGLGSLYNLYSLYEPLYSLRPLSPHDFTVSIFFIGDHYSEDTFYYLEDRVRVVGLRACGAGEQRVFFNQHHPSCFAIKSLHPHQVIAQAEMEHEDDQYDMLDDSFIPQEFEGTDGPMQFSPLKNEYDSNADLLEVSTLSSNVKNMLSILQEQKQAKQN
ncbi:hypothetical protein G7Y79_00008g024040 [Physcia stellaris]|nr:hypothetical protein G7Y79_00008g024040 [Physcia stellaris]